MADAAAFFDAVRAGDAARVGALLAADPGLLSARNAQGQSAVLLACYAGRGEIRDLLIERGARMELHEAAAAGALGRVRELLDAEPALAKAYSPDGFPLLALAAAFGHEEVARYLHSLGADINAAATNGTGYTALTGAVAGGHKGIAGWLAENGADVNYRYAQGYSPLLTAAANGRLEIVEMLLANGAELHARTDDGRNALHLAQERGHEHVAGFLRRRGLTA